MAPVSPMTRGHGVPGGSSPEPGITHIYLLRTLSTNSPIIRSLMAADESEPHYEARVFRCAHRTDSAALHTFIPSGAFHSQVSQANKTKRGLYVYQA